mmetsp:Transcript_8662/g.14842  ORF Transcript_8662/g.14842 Transcript_8662/m.14842 type:complete len:125 (+) Transcript_8662:83-457(+)
MKLPVPCHGDQDRGGVAATLGAALAFALVGLHHHQSQHLQAPLWCQQSQPRCPHQALLSMPADMGDKYFTVSSRLASSQAILLGRMVIQQDQALSKRSTTINLGMEDLKSSGEREPHRTWPLIC